jgi:hypothetical protein
LRGEAPRPNKRLERPVVDKVPSAAGAEKLCARGATVAFHRGRSTSTLGAMGEVTVDFIARDQPHGGWSMVLVEEGPWQTSDLEANLRRVQDRLYCCLDAALAGLLARRYPGSVGKPLVIRLEAFDVPKVEVADFFERFASTVPTLPNYASAIAASRFVPSVAFELQLSDLPHSV